MSDSALRTAAADAGGTNLETSGWYALGNAGSQVSTQRLQPTYGAAANGVADITSVLSFTGAASAAVSHLQCWSASTGGTLRFERPLSGDLAFNAAGEFDVTSVTVTVS